VRVAVRHLEVFDDLAFIPDMIAGGHHIDAKIEKFLGERRSDSKSRCGILAIGDYQIDRVLLAKLGQAILNNVPPRAAKNVSNEKNFQNRVSGS
jgi:hypothetical protein